MNKVLKRTLISILMVMMVVTFVPSLSGIRAYAGVEGGNLSGTVYSSELTRMGDYTLTDDTTINVDASIIISSISVGNYTLTIEGNDEDLLSIYGKGIEGYNGNVVLNSGKLDIDTSTGSGKWIAAINLTVGGFTMNGGNMFMNYNANGTYSSAGISSASFTMNGGTANITCETNASDAIGIKTNDFTMTGGELTADAKTTVSGQYASGIEANGSSSDSDFHMSGGTLSVTAIAGDGDESYGINWTGQKDSNNFLVDGGKLTAKGVRTGINSWVPVTIMGGADVTASSTSNTAVYSSEGKISIRGIGTKVTATSQNADAIDAIKSTIDLGSGTKIVQPEGGYVAEFGEGNHSIKNASDEWAKQVVIEGVSREEITQIIATSDITTPVYGEPIPYPEITVETGSPAYFSEPEWYKKTDDDWEEVSGGTFTEGTYKISAMIRIDQGGTEYILGWPVIVTVDGVEWTSGWDAPEVYETYSRLGIGSPEYVVTAPPDAPLIFNDKSSYDIGTTYIGEAITDFSVASSAEGGKTPYVFSKTSGPDWISVSSDGVVSGTPSATGINEDLVIRVTDANGDYKEITIGVAITTINPADRTAITEIAATSNIAEPVYGAVIPDPVITVEYGAPAYFDSPSWYKKIGDTWEEVTEETFSEGTYQCAAIIRIDEGGTEYVLGWPLKVMVGSDAWTSGWDGPEVYDTYSRLGIGSPEYVVEKCPKGGGHDFSIVTHKGSFTADGYQSFECIKCGKPKYEDGVAIGALKVKTVKLVKTTYDYTGKAIKPTVTLATADGPLNKDYYTVTYSNNKNVGTGKVKITLKGAFYEGTKTLDFSIKGNLSKDVTKVSVSKIAHKKYTGSVITPTPTVKAIGPDGKVVTLKKGTDYTLKATRKAVGKATLTITGKGKYKGTKKVTFKIIPKGTTVSGATASSKALTVKWKKLSTKMTSSRITGYQIQVATDSAFKKNAKKITVKGYANTSKKITKLLGGKKYYVRIRTYMKVDGTTYYSKWAKWSKTVKTKA